jgi:hypothetical protein
MLWGGERGERLRPSILAVVVFIGAVGACGSGQLGSSNRGGSSGGSPASGGSGGGQAGAIAGQGGGGSSGGIAGQGSGGQAGEASVVGGAPGSGGAEDVCSAVGNGPLGLNGGAGRAGCCGAYLPQGCVGRLCGNGVIDACDTSSAPSSCSGYARSEQCDGTDLAGQTCAGQGYGSGTLECSTYCLLDTTGCYACLAGTPPVAACGLVSASPAFDLSMAATDTETALVWVDLTSGVAAIGFAIVSSDLKVISSGSIADGQIAAGERTGLATVQVAALPSGWLVAAFTGSSITLYTLDGAGTVVGQKALDPMTNGSVLSTPMLVSQPNGGPLVIWTVSDIYAAVVSADGGSVTAPITISPDTSLGYFPLQDAAFAAGEFRAAISASCQGVPCVQIVSIAPDGTLAGSFVAPNVDALGEVRIVSGANDLELFYETCVGTASSGCLKWQSMSATGTALSTPVVVDGVSSIGQLVSAVALGSESYALLATTSPPYSPTLAHLASDGTGVVGPTVIARGGAAQPVLVRQGSQLVAGWVGVDIVGNQRGRIEVEQMAP